MQKYLSCLTFLAALILGVPALRANTQPTIFNWSRSANPGDVISLQGDSFGNSPEVWIEQVTGTETALTPAIQLAVLSGTGSLYGSSSNSCVTALIPGTVTPGLLALWVSADGGGTFSPPVYINQAMPWNADDLCGSQVDPNRQFHLYGRNLEFSGTGTPTVNFVSTSSTLAATVASGTDPYILSVQAPSAVQGGVNYTLIVNNGFGGKYGTVAGPVLSGTITGGSDPFGLGVPWGADFASYSSHVYHVAAPTGIGATDQSNIQNAINAVSGSGSGIVALQSGTYVAYSGAGNSCLVMATGVVIEGTGTSGSNSTTIEMTGTSPYNPFGYEFGLNDGARNLIDTGLYNLTLYNSPTGGSSCLSFGHPDKDKFFAVNTNFRSDVTNCVVFSGSQAVFKNCTIYSGSGVTLSGTLYCGSPVGYSGVINSVMQNNFFQYYAGRLWLSNGGEGMLIESNTMSRIAYSGTLGETGALDVQQSQDTVAIGNVFQRDPTLSGTYNMVQNNDGETIMNQTGHDDYPCQGGVSSSSSNTLTDTTETWAANQFVNAPDGQDYYVTIIQGAGAGQIHKVIANTATTLTVDSPWQVLPKSDSMYSVHHLESLRHLIKDNTLTGCVQGVVYYSISTKDTAIVNNTLYNNGGIYFRCDYRPSTTGSSQFDVQFDTLIAGNSVTVTPADPYIWTDSYAYIADWVVDTNNGLANPPGTQVFCTEFRDNTLTAVVPDPKTGSAGEGFTLVPTTNGGESITDGTTAISVGAVFQGNTAVSCSNAFHLCTGDYYTTFWNNTLDNCGAPVLDGTAGGISHASIATVYGPVTPAITSQPQSATIIEGGTATFTVTASGLTAPGYQWQRMPVGSGTWSNMTNISGTYVGTATGTVTVTNASLAMNGDQFQCVASNGYLPNASSGTAILTVETGYSAWASGVFGSQFSNPSISGPAATPQNDGIPNAVKYLCGINPATPMSASSYAALPVAGMTTTSGTSYLTLTYRQNPSTPGLTLSVQTCTDMKSWTTVTPYSSQPIGTDPTTGDSIIQIKIQNGGGKLFARLQLTIS